MPGYGATLIETGGRYGASLAGPATWALRRSAFKTEQKIRAAGKCIKPVLIRRNAGGAVTGDIKLCEVKP